MRITNEQYQAIVARQAARKVPRPRPVVQEQQDADPGPAYHQSQKAKVDGRSGGKFAVTIEILVSDKRDRDIDGAVSTLLDCYLMAVGRFTQLDRTDLRKLAKSLEG
jgi:hypothetical protein